MFNLVSYVCSAKGSIIAKHLPVLRQDLQEGKRWMFGPAALERAEIHFAGMALSKKTSLVFGKHSSGDKKKVEKSVTSELIHLSL